MELPTDEEKEILQELACSLKGSNAQERGAIYDNMSEILDKYITKAYNERLEEEFKNFAPVSDKWSANG